LGYDRLPTAASISGSFLGAKVSHGSLDVCAILALIAFVLCIGCAIWVLLPQELVFAFRGEALLGVSDHEGVEDVVQAYRAAGLWMEPPPGFALPEKRGGMFGTKK
jgi:hypothetical protein